MKSISSDMCTFLNGKIMECSLVYKHSYQTLSLQHVCQTLSDHSRLYDRSPSPPSVRPSDGQQITIETLFKVCHKSWGCQWWNKEVWEKKIWTNQRMQSVLGVCRVWMVTWPICPNWPQNSDHHNEPAGGYSWSGFSSHFVIFFSVCAHLLCVLIWRE